MLQVLSMPRIDLTRSWATVQASLKRQVTSKAPGTALLSRLNHAWNERNFRYEIAGELLRCVGKLTNQTF